SSFGSGSSSILPRKTRRARLCRTGCGATTNRSAFATGSWRAATAGRSRRSSKNRRPAIGGNGEADRARPRRRAVANLFRTRRAADADRGRSCGRGGGTALPAGDAENGKAVLGRGDQFRTARLGGGPRRLPLHVDSSDFGETLAGDSGDAARIVGRRGGLPGAARVLPGQSLPRRREDGPAPGSRRDGGRAGGVRLARRRRAVPLRRHHAQGTDTERRT